MRRLSVRGSGPLTFLFLGAHCDDIEIGCGGFLLKLAEEQPDAIVHWVVLSSDDRRANEARDSAAKFLDGVSNANIRIETFRNSYFPYIGADIKEYFNALKDSMDPDVIFTHYKGDLHQDHRLVAELTWNTWRNHLILEYEIPKYDGGLASPNVFFDFDKATMDRKVDVLLESFATQRSRPWFTDDTFRGLARLRGIECNATGLFAEAFYARKIPLTL